MSHSHARMLAQEYDESVKEYLKVLYQEMSNPKSHEKVLAINKTSFTVVLYEMTL